MTYFDLLGEIMDITELLAFSVKNGAPIYTYLLACHQ